MVSDGSTLELDGVARRSVATFGVVLFLASDLMLFAGFFAAFFLIRARSAVWPPAGVTLDVAGAAIGTVLLLTSSATFWWSHRAYRRARIEVAQRWLILTALLGLTFATNQLRDYLHIGFHPADHAYGGIYWTLTGLHGLHVLSGLCAIGLLGRRLAAAPSKAGALFEGTGLFWHLVDAVWLALFVTIWLLR